MENFVLTIFQVLAVLFSIVLHEVSHGTAANSLGDPTAKQLGRLTLNPFKHLDPFGSVILPFLTYFATGFVFGYAKPVPYNPLNLRDQRYGAAKVAIAGPATNLVIAVLFGLVLRGLDVSGLSIANQPFFFNMLSFVVQINLLLAIFNLMPVPPLDGHWLALTFFPSVSRIFRQFGMFLFVLLLFFVLPLIIPLVSFLFRIITGL